MKKLALSILALLVLFLPACSKAEAQSKPTIDIISDRVITLYTLPASAKIPGYEEYTVYKIATLGFRWRMTGRGSQWTGSEVARIHFNSDAILLHVDGYIRMNATEPTATDWFETTLNINDQGICELSLSRTMISFSDTGFVDQFYMDKDHWDFLLPLQQGDYIRIGSAMGSHSEAATEGTVFYYLHWIEKPRTGGATSKTTSGPIR